MPDQNEPAKPGDESNPTHPTDSDTVKQGVEGRDDDERQTPTPPPHPG